MAGNRNRVHCTGKEVRAAASPAASQLDTANNQNGFGYCPTT